MGVWLCWRSSALVELSGWACGYVTEMVVVEVGVRLCGRGERVVVRMKWACDRVVEMGVWSFPEMAPT